MAEREVTSLVQVSHATVPGEAGEAQGVVSVSPDGSRVYFVAHGVLSDGPNAEGRVPSPGAENLYVYDSRTGGAPAFIGELCSGPEQSGGVKDVACAADLVENDSGLWSSTTPEAQTFGEGGVFVFSTYARLSSDDVDSARDVYRYEAVSGKLERVSVGEAGFDANGNNSLFDARIAPPELESGNVYVERDMNSRAVTEDGSRIVFTTADPLSRMAKNGVSNAYEWYEAPGASGGGRVSLVSTGSSPDPVNEVVISPGGSDVFFMTTQGLVAQDTDGQKDLYDARMGAGFPALPAGREECSGDACQGPLTNPAPSLVPGSVSQAPGGNFPPPVPAAPSVSKAKVKPARCKRGHLKRKGKCGHKANAKRTTGNQRAKS